MFKCPKCSTALIAPAEPNGQIIQCHQCGQVLQLPKKELRCPQCHSDNVQSFKAVYETGTQTVATVSGGIVANQAAGWGTGGFHQTHAAAQCSPPKKRPDGGAIGAISVGVFAILVSLCLFAGGSSDTAVSGVVFLLIGIACIGGGSATLSDVKKWNSNEWPALHNQWLASFRCLRCGHTFQRKL
jgi:hypothetical protein